MFTQTLKRQDIGGMGRGRGARLGEGRREGGRDWVRHGVGVAHHGTPVATSRHIIHDIFTTGEERSDEKRMNSAATRKEAGRGQSCGCGHRAERRPGYSHSYTPTPPPRRTKNLLVVGSARWLNHSSGRCISKHKNEKIKHKPPTKTPLPPSS